MIQQGLVVGMDDEPHIRDTCIDHIGEDEIDNAVYQMCQVLTEDEDLPWGMEYIGEIADFAAELLVKCGYKVRFPCIVEEDGEEHIEEYVKLDEEPIKQLEIHSFG